MSRDILLLLGLPALLIAGIGYATWPWASPRYSAPSQEAFFETATGVWDRNSEGSCIDDPYFISFSDDRALMFVVMREPWKVKDGDSVRLAIYDLSEKSPSHVRGQIRGEERLTASGTPVVWDLILRGPDRFVWHQTDLPEILDTGELHRCPSGTDSLFPALTDRERAALGR